MGNLDNSTANFSPEAKRVLLSQLLQEKAKKAEPFFSEWCVHHLFEQQVERTPDAIAVVFKEQQLTYRQLNQKANQLAHHLQSLGVGPEVIVGICVERSLEMVTGLLGILKAGGAYLPLDPTYPSAHLRLLLASTEACVLLSQHSLRERLLSQPSPASFSSFEEESLFYLDSDWAAIAKHCKDNLISGVTAENLAYVIHSSGQEIPVEHRGVSYRLDWLQNAFALSKSDGVLHHAPLGQDTATLEIFWPLVTAGRLVIAEAAAQDNQACLQPLIAEQKVSVVRFIPSALSTFVTSLSGDLAPQLSSLRLVLCSGGPLRRSVVEAFREHCTGEIHNIHSSPEAAGEITSFDCKRRSPRDILPIGHPTYRSVYILDGQLQPLPVGVKGEIYVGGPGLPRGYRKSDEDTVLCFVDNPFSKTAGAYLLKTGELGRRLHDGTLELVESYNRQAWIEGFRVELQEVEAALLAAPSVEDCRVLVRQTEVFIPQLVAYVVLSGSLSSERLHSHMQALLPTHMRPCAYVPLSNLPLTKAGQVDEQALARLEVIDINLLQRWEEQLQALPEIEHVAVVVQEQTKRLPLLHLSDLLPKLRSRREETIQSFFPSSASIEVPLEEKLGSKRLAIRHGEPLQQKVDSPTTLPEALQRAAQSRPVQGLLYLKSDGSESSQSYEDLLEETQRVLAGLRKLGLKPQDKVIFQLDRNQDFILAFWGCMLGGFVPVPISVAPTYHQLNSTVSKLQNVWQMLGRPLVLTSKGLAPAVRSLSELFHLENFQVETINDLRRCTPDSSWHDSQPEDLAILLLTSGSTGIPKAVMQSHRSLLNRSAATVQMNNFTSNDVSLNWLSLEHVGSLVMFHLRDVYLGCRQIHAPAAMVLQKPLRWLDWIDRYKATITWAPNFAYTLLNARKHEISQRDWDLSSMRFILNGGEAIVVKHAREFLELLAPKGLPTTAMHPAWGMAETCSGVVYSESFSLDSTKDDDSFVEIGAPIPGFSIRIVDAQDQVVKEEIIGRLQVKGLTVTSGYYQNPEINREDFTADGWFNTGDLGFVRSGRLTVTGREKDTIIIHGLNYYSHELESIVEAIKGVEVSYTAAVAVRSASSDTDELVIFFNTAIADEAAMVKLIQEIRSKVVENLGVNPNYLLPIEKETIPKTAIGKIQRAHLRKCFEAGEFNDLIKQLDLVTKNAHTLPDWFYQKVWCPKEALTPVHSLQTGPTLIFLDNLGLGMFLVEELDRRSQPCVSVEAGLEFVQLSPDAAPLRYRINPNDPEHYRRLIESLVAHGLQVALILHLWTYDEYAGEVSSLAALAQAQEQGTHSLLFLVQALALFQGPDFAVRLQVISSHGQPTSPNDKIAYEKSTLIGLLKTIPLELSWLQCSHIDLEVAPVEVNAEYILQELRVLNSDSEIAYRNGRRLISSLAKVDMLQQKTQDIPLKQGGVYLVTGGLGGIGAYLSQFLIREYCAKLIIVGRTELPNKAEWASHMEKETLVAERIKSYQAIEAAGSEFIYAAVDICDKASLDQVIAVALSKWNEPLAGIIHLAGEGNLNNHWTVMDEHWVLSETLQTLDSMLRPKMYGTWVLYQIIKNDPEAVFVSFSSVNGVFGGATFSAYSAANSFLDCYSLYHRYYSRAQTYCFNWTMWDDVGMSQGNPAYARDAAYGMGYCVISKEQGLSSLLAGLYRNQNQLIVGLDSSNQNIRRNIKLESDTTQKLMAYYTTSSDYFSEFMVDMERNFPMTDLFGVKSCCNFVQLEEMPLAQTGEIEREKLVVLDDLGHLRASERTLPRTEVERQLAIVWQNVLGIERVGVYDNFFELGGHSLLAAQLISRVRDVFDVKLPLRALFEQPNIAGLSAFLEQPSSEINNSPLVRIRPQGSLKPLFCIHPLGGTIGRYTLLTTYLHPQQPFYALQAVGLEQNQKAYSRIEEMASAYINALQQVQPEGPYQLAGWSFGGLVAFEIAQQLQAQEQEVGALLLMDSPAPASMHVAEQQENAVLLADMLNMGILPSATLERWGASSTEVPLEKLLEEAIEDKLLPSDFDPSQAKRFLQVARSNLQAARHYVPTPYQGRIALIQAAETPPMLRSESLHAWEKLATAGVDSCCIQGDHYSILAMPHIQELANQIQNRLLKT
jgi:amino acid adenylation domain-containing protein